MNIKKYIKLFEAKNANYTLYDKAGVEVVTFESKGNSVDIKIGQNYKTMNAIEFIKYIQNNLKNIKTFEVYDDPNRGVTYDYYNSLELYVYSPSTIDEFLKSSSPDDEKNKEEAKNKKKQGYKFVVRTYDNKKMQLKWFKNEKEANEYIETFKR